MAESPDDDAATVAAMTEENTRRENPMRHYRCSSEGQEKFARYVARGVETYGHAAERAGKTSIGCALDACFSRGLDRIMARDSSPILIPVLNPPVRGLLGFDSYKIGGAAVMQTLRAMLGVHERDWKETGGAEGSPSLIRVRHELARSEDYWSEIRIFPYDGVLPRSMELDFAHPDEPPPVRYYEALQARRGATRRLRLYTTATPLDPRLWRPFKAKFPEREDVIEDGAVRVRWSVFDNEALPETVKNELQRTAMKSDFWKAKLYGEHVIGSGGCPWPTDLLQALLSACIPPKRTESLSVEMMASGERKPAQLQVWEDAIEGDPYYIVGDPAKGINDGQHDPDGMHVRNRRTKALAARLSGYLGGWGLGNAMADMHARYNGAICDVLTTGGYGEAPLQALRKRGVYSLVHDRVEVRPGEWENRIGTVETHELRGKIIGAVGRAIDSGSMICPSAEIIACLLECVKDETGKILAMPGGHDEDLICWGRAEVFMGQWDAPEKAKPAIEKWVSPFDTLLEKSLGYKPRQVQRRIRSRAAAL